MALLKIGGRTTTLVWKEPPPPPYVPPQSAPVQQAKPVAPPVVPPQASPALELSYYIRITVHYKWLQGKLFQKMFFGTTPITGWERSPYDYPPPGSYVYS